MYDRGLSVLEQYGLTAKSSYRGRGALLCHTEKGLLILREFRGSAKRLEKQREFLLQVQKQSGENVDQILVNQAGELVSVDKEGIPYVLKNWYEGKECDTKSQEDVIKSVEALARLHRVMKLPVCEEYVAEPLDEEYLRHNRELRRIQKFIRKKGAGNSFEKAYLSSVEWFLERGTQALKRLETSGYQQLRQTALEEGSICHGEYNQHNVLMLKRGTAVTNFEKWSFDVPMADLYRFMRKVLEKNNWDVSLAREILKAYHRQKPLTAAELENLQIRFSYPEKYWKLGNYYFTHRKSWISEKNVEKILQLIEQKNLWEDFEKKCFCNWEF